MQKNTDKYLLITGCLILTVFLLCGCKSKSDLVITESETVAPMEESVVADVSDETLLVSSEDGPEQEKESETIYVQVTGAVRAPGVYEMTEGSRVFEAVQKAGGMTDEAAADCINQAVEVTDGDMIVLYTRREWEQIKAGQTAVATGGEGLGAILQADDGKVNINTADVTQLCSIPGIGESRAQSIVTYREQNGSFESVEDIMKVSGIKDGLFQKIKDKIKV